MNERLTDKWYLGSLIIALEDLRDKSDKREDRELLQEAIDYINEIWYRFETGELQLNFRKENNNEN